MIVVLGGILGFILGLKWVLFLSLCFVVFVIWDTESKQRSFDRALEIDKKNWDERVKRGFPGIRF